MCGIVGMAGRIFFKEEKAFKDLLYMNALRGKHSVGIGAVDQKGERTVLKRAISVDDFLDTKPVEVLFRKQLRVLIGHNRFATVGKINHNNAHPFEMEHVMGVHNGSLKNMNLLQDHDSFDVDSEAIYHNINELGVAETAKRLDGAWALVWWDNRDNTLHMWRNEERPLFYVYSKDRKCIFWASEPRMLDAALQRHGVEYTDTYEVTPHNEYKFAIPLDKDETINDIKITPVEAYKRPAYSVSQGANNFAKKTLALVTKTAGGGGVATMPIGTKVRFYIDQLTGKSASGYLIGCPINVDTSDVEVVGIKHGQGKYINKNIDMEWEGIVNSRARYNGGPPYYIVQANSLKLFSGAMGNDIIPNTIDEPEVTVVVGNQALTRREFMREFGHCTCRTCGMDLEFVNGIQVTHFGTLPDEYTCASCVEESEDLRRLYHQRRH